MATATPKQEKTQMPPTAPTKSHLLTIPTEIRLEIYTLILADFTIHNIGRRVKGRLMKEPPLLQVCRTIREESIDVFNKRMTTILDRKQEEVRATELQLAALQKRSAAEQSPGLAMDDLLSSMLYEQRRHLFKAELKEFRRMVENERSWLRLEAFQV